MEYRGPVIEAANRFGVKAEFALFETRTDEIQLIRETLKSQLNPFLADLKELSPAMSENLMSDLGSGLEINLFAVLDDPDEQPVIQDQDYAVINQKCDLSSGQHGDTNCQPNLTVSVLAIENAHKLLMGLFIGRDGDAEANRHHLEAATGMTAWMASAKWAFDKADPLVPGQEASSSLIHSLSGLAGLTQEDIGSLTNGEATAKIEEALVITKYRFMGMMAIRYLKRYADEHVSPDSFSQQDLDFFERLYPGMFETLRLKAPEQITAMEFSLANPLSPGEAATLLGSL